MRCLISTTLYEKYLKLKQNLFLIVRILNFISIFNWQQIISNYFKLLVYKYNPGPLGATTGLVVAP